MDSSDTSTTKFQQSLPYALLSVSPSLSALHYQRFRNEEPTVASADEFCLKCGFFLLDGRSRCRSVRTPGRRIRKLQCARCSHVLETTRDAGNAPHFPPTRRRARSTPVLTTPNPSPAVVEELRKETPVPPVVVTPVPQERKAIKPRQKKKSVLQDMLARNRKREETKPAAPSGGLAAFLNGL